MKKLVGIFIILMLIILISPNAFARYGGIDTNIEITDGDVTRSNVEITERIVGTLQVAGTIISIIALIIIGMRYMFSSINDKAKIKGVMGYYIIGCVLVFCTSNVLGFTYGIIKSLDGSGHQHSYKDVRVTVIPTCKKQGKMLRECEICNEQITVPIAINNENHNMSEWETQKLANCVEVGKKQRFCNNGCGKMEEEEIEINSENHKNVVSLEDYEYTSNGVHKFKEKYTCCNISTDRTEGCTWTLVAEKTSGYCQKCGETGSRNNLRHSYAS